MPMMALMGKSSINAGRLKIQSTERDIEDQVENISWGDWKVIDSRMKLITCGYWVVQPCGFRHKQRTPVLKYVMNSDFCGVLEAYRLYWTFWQSGKSLTPSLFITSVSTEVLFVLWVELSKLCAHTHKKELPITGILALFVL